MSSVDAIAAVTEILRTEIDRKQNAKLAFFDLQKTFDTWDHDILFEK